MARSTSDPRLSFRCLYHDELSGLTREFQLRYYWEDSSVELTDMHTKKLFLKRSEAKNLERSDFVLGKKVVVFGRLLHLCEYLDVVTRQLCEGGARATELLPDTSAPTTKAPGARTYDNCYLFVEASQYFHKLGTVLSVLDVELGLTVIGITAGTLPRKAYEAAVASEHTYGSMFPMNRSVTQLQSLSGKMVCAFRVARPNLEERVLEIPRRLSSGGRTNGLCAFATIAVSQLSSSGAAPQHPLEIILDAMTQRTAQRLQEGASGTVVIIKPHIVVSRTAGDVLQWLLDQSRGAAVVDAMSLISLSSMDASKLMAPYRGVLPDFSSTVAQLCAGASIAVHLCSPGTAANNATADAYRDGNTDALTSEDAGGNSDEKADEDLFHAVRALCGPYDPAIAKALRPATLRARYGVHRAENAVHCCDDIYEVATMAGWLWGVIGQRKVAQPSSEAS